ncbi:DNA helicase UvrD, partial [Candidatus Gottesmanbacteria bacterium]|nr:DNA helicase UvrD [Candidatus Gottesmanbacteria bacterium]
MQIIADLQLHSKYSRAVSQQMIIPQIFEWAKRKGIKLIATGDWTHPLWMREIKANLTEDGSGLLKLKTQMANVKTEEVDIINTRWEDEKEKSDYAPKFLLATEVSSIYSQGGKLRRIHNLIWAPTIATAEKINKELVGRGANLIADGRPIIGLTSIQVAELVLSIDPTCLIIPAHCWTPWFSLYGSESGFDSIDECFGSFAKYIYAVETGLSSSPAMNWRIKELDNRSIVSFSDAHSGPKLGREATVFESEELSYSAIREAISQIRPIGQIGGKNRIAYTIEFYPEEGKYHYTGHRNCDIKQNPSETKQKGTICPVCGKKLTIGVMHRVEQLAGRKEEELGIKNQELSGTQIKGIFSAAFPHRPPFIKLVPLQEILAESLGGLPTSQNIQNEYKKLTDYFGDEFKVLLEI